MEIKILENQTIYLKGKKENVLINPNEESRNDAKYPSRIFLFTAEKYDGMGFDSDKILIRAPGEYEVGGIEINGYPVGENTIYIIHMDGIKMVFLGDLNESLSDKRIEKIDSADVLFAPVLIKDSNSGKLVLDWAKKWGINYLIPTGYSDEDKTNLDKFLDQADHEGLDPVESLKVDKDDLPDGMELKVLKKV